MLSGHGWQRERARRCRLTVQRGEGDRAGQSLRAGGGRDHGAVPPAPPASSRKVNAPAGRIRSWHPDVEPVGQRAGWQAVVYPGRREEEARAEHQLINRQRQSAHAAWWGPSHQLGTDELHRHTDSAVVCGMLKRLPAGDGWDLVVYATRGGVVWKDQRERRDDRVPAAVNRRPSAVNLLTPSPLVR